ncbi:MAG: hypothetical protein LBL24_11985 [Bacteroidales bacterium]|nr:hypothetical protein [Bacteroidales bacterium]
MIEFDDFIYHKSRIPKEDTKFFEDLEKKFSDEITQSPKATAYFEKFKAADVKYFIQSYAQTKANLVRFYNLFNSEYREHEEYEYRFHERAESALHAILQKKLFNIQLKWRANLLKFESNLEDLNRPGLDVCFDFIFWEQHIASCPFIEPIGEHEKDMMKEYLLTVVLDRYEPDIDTAYWFWQHYEIIMEKDEDGDLADMPEWYEFYDLRAGTGSLLLLPNLREEKENFYLKLSRNNGENQTSSMPLPVETDNRPELSGYGQDLIDFAKAFETDKHFIQLFKGYEVDYHKRNRPIPPEEVKYAIEELAMADRKITLPAHLNWDEAIVYAAKKYINTKTAEALDIVYDEYLMRCELGIKTAEKKDADLSNTYLDISRQTKKAILNGRIKNGEPANFDY